MKKYEDYRGVAVDMKKYKKCERMVEDARAMLKILGVQDGSLKMVLALPNIKCLFQISEDLTNPYR